MVKFITASSPKHLNQQFSQQNIGLEIKIAICALVLMEMRQNNKPQP